MKKYRAFYDKTYHLLTVMPEFDERIPRYSLYEKVVYWDDITAETDKDAHSTALLIGREKRLSNKNLKQ